MDDEQKQAELLASAEAAAFTADLLSQNIKKYLELHAAALTQYKFVMKIADETKEATAALVSQAAELAAKTLQEFLKRQRESSS